MTGGERLAALADEYWDGFLEAHPLIATQLGDRRFNDRLDDITPSGRARRANRLREQAARAAELGRTADLADADEVTRAALAEAIAGDLALLESDHYAYTVDPLDGPQVALLNVPAYQPAATDQDREQLLDRWRQMAPWIDEIGAHLRRGLTEERPPVAALVRRVVGQLDDLLTRPVGAWPLAVELDSTTDELLRVVEDEIRPAFGRYRSLLVDAILPHARSGELAGLVHLPGGEETYRRLARWHTTMDLDPEELHRIGLAEIQRIDGEFAALGRAMFGTLDLASTLDRLRSDPALHFSSRDEVEDVARRSLERANQAVPEWFGRLPTAACEVVRMAEHEEKHSTIAYYREPAADGSRPGQYYINTSVPESRPRYEAEALAFHESVPGHHLQIALAQDLDHLPAFRRLWGTTAYIEGWGLYTERLADEVGLYSTDLDRFGILSFDAWRACRLVVDTGMHALGWSRDEAIAFIASHTALGENNIANEVDRYIAIPGQALAYKVGQLELLRLRSEARTRLGGSFDIRRFHDAVLGEGALPLDVLRAVVEERLS